jgi:hypothetical protein
MSAIHVHSIRDIPYELVPTLAFHPCARDAAAKRIVSVIANTDSNIAERLAPVLADALSRNTWGIVIEIGNEPHWVIQNLAHTRVPRDLRRVVVVRVPHERRNPL